MRRIMTLVALICAFTYQASAQQAETNIERGQRLAESADNAPNDWQKQFKAAEFYLSYDNGTPDLKLGEKYITRALELAQKETVRHDTILGKSYELMSVLEMEKKDYEKMVNYYEQAILAYVDEFGYQNAAIPPRIATLASYKYLLYQAGTYVYGDVEAIKHLRDALWLNQQLPQDKQAQGMDQAATVYALSHEMVLAEQMSLMKDKVWQYYENGKSYTILALDTWTIEQPTGFIATLVYNNRNGKKKEDYQRGFILMDEQGNIIENDVSKFYWNLSVRQHENSYILDENTTIRVVSIPAGRLQQIIEAFKEFEKNGK